MNEKLKKEYEETRGNFISNTIERIFDKLLFALKRDVTTTFLVLMILLNGYMTVKLSDSYDARMRDKDRFQERLLQYNDQFRDRMIEEIRRQMEPTIKEDIENRTEDMNNKINNSTKLLKEIKQIINEEVK